MKSFAEQLLEYFNNTPREELDKEWNEVHIRYAYGITVGKLVEDYNMMTCLSQDFNSVQNFSTGFDGDVDFAQAV